MKTKTILLILVLFTITGCSSDPKSTIEETLAVPSLMVVEVTATDQPQPTNTPITIETAVELVSECTVVSSLPGAEDKIPTDRLIDGIDQSTLMLEGETNGRRDYVFLYSINTLEAVVKERFKIIAPKPGENPIGAKFYDLYRDTREELPVSTEIGAWGGQEFVRIIQRHMMRKQKYPDEGPALGRPYDGIENLRPESKAAVEAFLIKQASPMQ